MSVITKFWPVAIDRLRGTNLKARCARGSIFLFAGNVSGSVLKFIRRMLLARLLVPSEIGLMAIVIAISTALEAFTEVGVRQSIIQNKRGGTREYLNVSWWFQLIRTSALFAVAFWLAPWVGSFYEEPRLVLLLRVAFLSMIFSGLTSPRTYALEKELKFGKLILISQGSAVAGTIVVVGFAFTMRNVWALVIGFVAERAACVILSFIVCPFRPSLNIERSCLSDLLTYARRMFGVPMLAMLAFQTDILVLGKTVTKGELGLYSFALLLAQMPSNLFSRIVNPVLLSAFAKKQDDKHDLCTAVLGITKVAAFIGMPILVFIAVYSGSIMSLVYGPRYAAAAVPFAILCGYSLIRIEGTILSSIYMAIGKPHLHRRFVVLRLIVLIILIYPSIVLFGLSGVAIVVFLANFIGLCLQVVWICSIIGLRFGSYASCWLPGLLVSPVVAVPFVILKFFGVESLIVAVLVSGLWLLPLGFILYRFYKPTKLNYRQDIEQVDPLLNAGEDSV